MLATVGLAPASASAATDTGFVGPNYAGATAPTGQKPQSKLWIADGLWWGSLFNTATTDFEIHRYDPSTQTWATTGTLIDERSSAFMDTLWDGSHLYVATAGTSATTSRHAARILRLSYDPATQSWRRDAGFPVTLTNSGVKSIVLAKDSAGTLWVTWTAAAAVRIAHSTTSDEAWTQPATLPVAQGSGIGPDEISSVIAYDGSRIGVMWSDQPHNTMWFASHDDGAPDTSWKVTAAYARPKGADDHINLNSLQADPAGRVFAVVKTSLTTIGDPLIHVLVLDAAGTWSSHVFGRVEDQHTRAVLAIDGTNRELYVFASAPCCSGGVIYFKKAPLDHLEFEPGLGTPFIASSSHPKINNPTTTKQILDASTDLVVLASDDSTRTYLFNTINLAEPPSDTTPPAVTATTPAAGATDAPTTTTVSATFSEPLDPATVSDTTFLLRGTDGSGIAGSVAYDPDTSTAELTPTAPLEPDNTYTATLVGGTSGVADPAGNHLQDSVSWTFTTAPAPPSTTRFSDDFSSDLSRWNQVVTTGDASAAIVDNALRVASTDAQGTRAYLRGTFEPAPTITGSVTIRYTLGEEKNATVFLRLLDANGNILVTLQRRAGTGQLQVAHGDITATTSTVLPVDTARRIALRVRTTAGSAGLDVLVDGELAYTDTTSSAAQPAGIQLGDDAPRRAYTLIADDVVVDAEAAA